MNIKRCLSVSVLLIILVHLAFSQGDLQEKNFRLGNEKVELVVWARHGQLALEQIRLTGKESVLESDADFALEIVWTDWIAPGMKNNGENPVTLSKGDFHIVDVNKKEGGRLELLLDGISTSLQIKLLYELDPDKYYLKRKIAIRDTLFEKHFLHKISAYDAQWKSSSFTSPLKEGGFGQPVAVEFTNGGFFAGLEYPAATNIIEQESDTTFALKCSRLSGKKISNQWIESEWVVLGLTPDLAVKKGFMSYLDDIKIEPNRPYTLYNSWYDLRGEKYPVGSYVKELHGEDYMTENNVVRLYNLFQSNFAEKYNVELDAFVLDDGWDVYESDWVLNKNQFPNGLTRIKDRFDQNGTSLGLWFGPSGGYSARMKRIDWYRDNGYEVVGEEKQWGGAQLCLGGKKYSQLFKRRTAAFVDQGVSYYKWDGFQISCSEEDHGHPTGLYSQVAILDTLISSIQAVHQVNPQVYHSVTSGTWLSPWWLMYANQIWMQGEDYGLAEVPSYDSKDAAITFRDVVLYDDLQNNKFWFPVSNMMTHGIIKGKLEELYLDTPLDKFADNVMLYFARGVSMYELYTSPDEMKEEEWKVVADALKWAKKHFNTLMNTEMVGGDPSKKESYGYIHLKGDKGVIAARNPFIDLQDLKVVLNPDFGLDTNASKLVLEKVYPYRWIAPELYTAGDTISLPLDGYETAIYEIYPLDEATEPLIAGVPFWSVMDNEGNFSLRYSESDETPILLNREMIRSMSYQDQKVNRNKLPLPIESKERFMSGFEAKVESDHVNVSFELASTSRETTLAFLFKSDEHSKSGLPHTSLEEQGKLLQAKFNGEIIDENFKMPDVASGWYSNFIRPGSHEIRVNLHPSYWKGKIEVWAIGNQTFPTIDLDIKMIKKSQTRIHVPQILDVGEKEESKLLGSIEIN